MLKERKLRDKHLVNVGGGQIRQERADKIGTHGYGKDAAEAVNSSKNVHPRR